HKEMKVIVPLAELFKKPTIRQLSQYIEKIGQDKKNKYADIPPAPKKDRYTLSSPQERIFILQQMNRSSTGYNQPSIGVLAGRPEIPKMETAFKELATRHESLRTTFHLLDEGPVQKIEPHAETAIEYYELRVDENQPSARQKEKELVSNFVRPFDLTRAPLTRLGLIKINSEKYILMMDIHHIISDGISISIYFKELMALYQGEQLPPLRIQYKDYAQWWEGTRQEKKGAFKRREEYWRGKMEEEEIPLLDLPTDYARPVVKGFDGKKLEFEIGLAETAALKQLALELDVTLFMLLLSTFNIVLSKLSGSETVAVGTPVAGRRHADLENIIGMFVNTLLLVSHPGGEKNYTGYLKETKQMTLEAFENQEYPFEELIEMATEMGDGKEIRDTGRNPLFDVMFTMLNMEMPSLEMNEFHLTPYEYENKIAKFDITLTVDERDQLFFAFQYSTKLFKKETIEDFRNYFTGLLNAISKHPGSTIKDL
ncbi:MAG: non-ribosomal peptide synthetase, partial [bacterium]|nr:non-ribosomal peptide synthetase [bacterium]